MSFALKDFESGRAFSKRCSTNNKRSLSFNYTTTTQASSLNISKKRKFVADGVFFAELNEMLVRELAEDGYSGVEVRSTPVKMEIIIQKAMMVLILLTHILDHLSKHIMQLLLMCPIPIKILM